jgi:hypothetical protein
LRQARAAAKFSIFNFQFSIPYGAENRAMPAPPPAFNFQFSIFNFLNSQFSILNSQFSIPHGSIEDPALRHLTHQIAPNRVTHRPTCA